MVLISLGGLKSGGGRVSNVFSSFRTYVKFDKEGPQKMFKKDFMYFSVTLQKEKFQDLIQ